MYRLLKPPSAQMVIGGKLWSAHWPLIILSLLLAGIGIATLYSVAGGLEPWGVRQINRLLFGIAIAFAITALPQRFWMRMAWPAYFAALALLIAVPVFGEAGGGAKRWLSLGGLVIQPAEIMKIALVLVLAHYYQWLEPRRISSLPFVFLPVLIVALPTLLVVVQPDLGTGALIAFCGLGVMFLAGVSVFYYMGGIASIWFAAPHIWERMHDYQRERVLVFLDPERDPLGKGYQVFQSQIALGSGGFSGKGFMQGTQSQLSFLPERHTDFIFTIFAEEMGFLGSATLLVLYALLFAMLIGIALRSRNQFGRLIAGGVALHLFLHTFINIAMVMGVLPVVGVPLPLMSYGGTSMLASLVALGLAMNAYVHRGEEISMRRRPRVSALARAKFAR